MASASSVPVVVFAALVVMLFALSSYACEVSENHSGSRSIVVDIPHRPLLERAVTTLFIANMTSNVPAEMYPAIKNAAETLSKYFDLSSTVGAEIYVSVDYLCFSPTTLWATFTTQNCVNDSFTQSSAYVQQKYRYYCPPASGNGFHGTVNINSCPSSPWYVGLNATAIPSGSIDLVSGMMHQFVHILGYRSLINVFLSTYYSYTPSGAFNAHAVYNNGGSYESGAGMTVSAAYMTAGPTYFEENPAAPISSSRMQLLTPSTYDQSTQLHHWHPNITSNPDELTAGSNQLMFRDLTPGSAVRVLGDNTVRALSAMGFSMRNCSTYTTCDSCSFGMYCYWCPGTNTCGDPSGDPCAGKAWASSCAAVSSSTTTSASSSGGGSSAAGAVSAAALELLF